MTPSASHVLVSLLLDAGAQSTLVARVSFWQTLVSWGLDEKQTATSWTLCRTEVESSAVTAERCKTTDIRICSPASSSADPPLGTPHTTNTTTFDAATSQVVFRAVVLASSLKFWQGGWHFTSCSCDRPEPQDWSKLQNCKNCLALEYSMVQT